MESDYYSFHSGKQIVTIAPNQDWPSRCCLRINGKLIRPDYSDPQEAAFFAARRDFGDEELEREFVGLRVSEDLDQWKRCTRSEMNLYHR